jgi:hypothetical protein
VGSPLREDGHQFFFEPGRKMSKYGIGFMMKQEKYTFTKISEPYLLPNTGS